MGFDPVFDRMPVGELREIFADFRRVRAEVVRAVGVGEDAVVVVAVVGIPSDVGALFDDEARLAELCGQPLGHGET